MLVLSGLHPMMGERLHIWRLANFQLERLPSVEDVYLFRATAHDNPRDERLFALAEVRDMTPLRDESGKIVQIPHLERMLMEALESMHLYQSHLPVDRRPLWNRVLLYVWPPLRLLPEEFLELMRKLWPDTEGLGLERIVLLAKIAEPGSGEVRRRMLHVSSAGGHELVIRESGPIETPIATLGEYRQKVVQLRRRGLVYPYEIIEMLTPEPEGTRAQLPPGTFTEYDLDEHNRLIPADRPYGKNSAGIVVGLIRNSTPTYPEGMTRVMLLGDPSHSLGSVAEPECRRIIEAINLAEQLRVPIEWFTLSAGAKISMESGTENMDWVARTLLGIESRPLVRRGFVPADGPEQWTAGTLFPRSSKKAARAINSASGNRPLVVIANLSGFDGSPESMRNLQLEYGAEIGRAITNFRGPIVFCAISRYHGGAFVVFSKALNESIEAVAVEGSYASVIGGVPAAAVVFAREVDARTQADPRVKEAQERLARADGAQKAALHTLLSELMAMVRSEKVGEVASDFDAIHTVERAQRVGSLDRVIPAAELRPYLIEAVERGIQRELQRMANQAISQPG